MSPKPKTELNYAFIDSQNLNLAIRTLGWKLDFARFRTYLAELDRFPKRLYNMDKENHYHPNPSGAGTRTGKPVRCYYPPEMRNSQDEPPIKGGFFFS